ncbi:MAG: hypothetical protein GY838_11885 [bacterium]|nr:hypothetical protein [bacterium]
MMRHERRFTGLVPLACLLLLATAVAAAPVDELSSTFGDTLRIPGEGVLTGLAQAGGDTLATLDVMPDSLSASGLREVRLVLRDSLGAVLLAADFSGVLDRTLAWDGESFWSCGDAADGSSILYKIVPDTLEVDSTVALVVEDAFTAPGHHPAGLAWDGRFLWLTDRDSGRVDRFDPEVDEFTRAVAAPAFSPWGLAWDGTRHWLTDSGTGRLYRLVGGRLRWDAVVAADTFLFRGRDVLLWHDGVDLRCLVEGARDAVKIEIGP